MFPLRGKNFLLTMKFRNDSSHPSTSDSSVFSFLHHASTTFLEINCQFSGGRDSWKNYIEYCESTEMTHDRKCLSICVFIEILSILQIWRFELKFDENDDEVLIVLIAFINDQENYVNESGSWLFIQFFTVSSKFISEIWESLNSEFHAFLCWHNSLFYNVAYL